MTSDEEELDRQVAELELPLVRIGKVVPGTTCVRGENESGMRALAAHLVEDCGVHRVHSRVGRDLVGAENVGTCPEQHFYHSSPMIETGSSQISEQKCSTSHNVDRPARSIPSPFLIYKSPAQSMS
jgi:hypothetical protein